jgi:hypothetical protein
VKDPVDHILRPRLPWRSDEGAITECGYDATKVKTLTREEFSQREKELGKQRTAMLTCMTCADTARRWGTWGDDPRLALQREIEWERGPYRWRSKSEHGTRLRDELVAINTMLETHRDEFLSILSANEERRAWLEKKAALSQRPKSSSGSGL